MIKEIINDTSLYTSLNYLLNKNDSCGLDGISTYQLPDYLKLNKNNLLKTIYKGNYKRGLIEQIDLLNAKAKIRKISKINSVDKLIEKCLFDYLTTIIEPSFIEESYAYQTNKGTLSAVEKAKSYIEQNNNYVIEIDIEDFFDNIDHNILINKLKKYINDRTTLKLIYNLIHCYILYDHKISLNKKGLLQGDILSPLLSNLYLNDLDHYLIDKYKYIRYADDIKIFINNKDEGYKIIEEINTIIKDLKLTLNANKTKILPSINNNYYGYKIIKKDKELFIERIKKIKTSWYNEWTPSSLSNKQSDYHILEDGILTKRDLTLLYENEEMKQYYPIEIVNTINTYSNITFDLNFFELMNNKSVTVNLFNKYGSFIGTFTPYNCQSNASLLIKQIKIYLDEKLRLKFAKEIIISSIRNIIMNLRYYNKHNKNLDNEILEITNQINNVKQIKEINKLLLLEAKCREIYYQSFNKIINNNDFVYTSRSRRPPKDKINAMLSFGNVFLYNRISSLINRTKLDNRISYVHSASKHKCGLCYDLSDIYKPLIVDRVIFTLINKNMIKKDKHFTQIENGIYLNDEGRALFIKELKDKLIQKVTTNNKQYTYLAVIKNDIHSLIHSLETEDPKQFNPYTDI